VRCLSLVEDPEGKTTGMPGPSSDLRDLTDKVGEDFACPAKRETTGPTCKVSELSRRPVKTGLFAPQEPCMKEDC